MLAFALFFPLDLAVAMAAVVHLFANIFKTLSSVRSADKNVLVRFGVPAILAAFIGARLLIVLLGLPPLLAYHVGDAVHYVQPIKAAIALIIVLFVFFEIAAATRRTASGSHLMTLGGMLSGFIAGFSGLQTSLRDTFLRGSGLPAADIAATGVVIGCLVDFSRISVYTAYFSDQGFGERGAPRSRRHYLCPIRSCCSRADGQDCGFPGGEGGGGSHALRGGGSAGGRIGVRSVLPVVIPGLTRNPFSCGS